MEVSSRNEVDGINDQPNAAIITANTTQSNQITVLQSQLTGANAAIVTANTALKSYTDNQISTARCVRVCGWSFTRRFQPVANTHSSSLFPGHQTTNQRCDS